MALVMATLLLAAGLAGSAWAQMRVLELDEDVLTGEIEKPEAFYLLRASSLTYDTIEPESSFLEELYLTVEEPPF